MYNVLPLHSKRQIESWALWPLVEDSTSAPVHQSYARYIITFLPFCFLHFSCLDHFPQHIMLYSENVACDTAAIGVHGYLCLGTDSGRHTLPRTLTSIALKQTFWQIFPFLKVQKQHFYALDWVRASKLKRKDPVQTVPMKNAHIPHVWFWNALFFIFKI